MPLSPIVSSLISQRDLTHAEWVAHTEDWIGRVKPWLKAVKLQTVTEAVCQLTQKALSEDTVPADLKSLALKQGIWMANHHPVHTVDAGIVYGLLKSGHPAKFTVTYSDRAPRHILTLTNVTVVHSFSTEDLVGYKGSPPWEFCETLIEAVQSWKRARQDSVDALQVLEASLRGEAKILNSSNNANFAKSSL